MKSWSFSVCDALGVLVLAVKLFRPPWRDFQEVLMNSSSLHPGKLLKFVVPKPLVRVLEPTSAGALSTKLRVKRIGTGLIRLQSDDLKLQMSFEKPYRTPFAIPRCRAVVAIVRSTCNYPAF